MFFLAPFDVVMSLFEKKCEGNQRPYRFQSDKKHDVICIGVIHQNERPDEIQTVVRKSVSHYLFRQIEQESGQKQDESDSTKSVEQKAHIFIYIPL
jgi:hypothetical protein